MSEQQMEIPLFPLHTVLFPQSRLQLHIFEPRYRQMVTDCIAGGGHFGVTLIREGSEVGDHAEPYMVGTLVRILDIHSYSDGRFDINVLAVSRFRIREIDEALPYRVVKAEVIEDFEPEDITSVEQTAEHCRKMCERIIRQHIDINDFQINVLFPDGPEGLSYAIANMMELPLLRKQALLESTDTEERLQSLIEMLECLVEPEGPRQLHAIDLREWVSTN